MEMIEKKKFASWGDVLLRYKKGERKKNKLIKWENKREEALSNGEYLPIKPPKPKKMWRKKRKKLKKPKIRKIKRPSIKRKPKKPLKKRVRKKRAYVSRPRKKRRLIRRKSKYAIHLVMNEKQVKCIGRYKTLNDMSYALDCYKKKHKDVIIPNEYKKILRYAVPIKRELVTSRIKRGVENKVTYLTDDMGKLNPYTTPEDSQHVILSKTPIIFENWYQLWNEEHKFKFVTFMDIWGDVVLIGLNSKFNFSRIILFKNKLIIEHDDKIDVIKCRCISESIKLYNKIMEFKVKYHKHNVLPGVKIFDGKHKLHTYYRNIIMGITGWSEWKTTYPTG